jgi:hypothetical protein
MPAWTSIIRIREGAVAAALFCAGPATQAGHELSYYPAFYPQEIRIEPLDPEAAANQFANTADPLHAYIGAAPRFAGTAPAHLKSIASLRSFIVASANPHSPRLQTRDARCRASKRIIAALAAAKEADIVVYPYPVTPYHADYLGYVDLVPDGNPATDDEGGGELTLKAAAGPGLNGQFRVDPADWDVAVDETPIDAVRRAGGGLNAWPAPPWVKEGWFQAYHLQRAALGDPAEHERADRFYQRLTHDEFTDMAERLNLERGLLTVLTRGCERVVVGYRIRREFYNDDFSNGIENILADSQSGFNSPVFVRTVKLKDFPWNGWLRLGIAERPAAAWNPVAGFTDAAGRLVWSTVGDDAFVPIPHNSRWVQNRVEVVPEEVPTARRSLRIPADAVMPQPATGAIAAVGPGKGAMT